MSNSSDYFSSGGAPEWKYIDSSDGVATPAAVPEVLGAFLSWDTSSPNISVTAGVLSFIAEEVTEASDTFTLGAAFEIKYVDSISSGGTATSGFSETAEAVTMWEDITWCFGVTSSIFIYENGVSVLGNLGPAGPSLAIKVSAAGVVSYWMDDVIVHTSAITATTDLKAWAGSGNANPTDMVAGNLVTQLGVPGGPIIYTAEDGEALMADTDDVGYTVLLPASVSGEINTVTIKDYAYNTALYSLTVDGGAETIIDATTFLIDTNGANLTFVSAEGTTSWGVIINE